MLLLYIADPLCSWCYGFGPELAMFAARHPGARIDVLMGGLRPYNREPMSIAFRTMLLEHWNQVAQASGLPFSRTAIDRPGFIYDTEPACRAVVAARTIDASGALAYLRAVQTAFYRDGRDATDDAVLADIAAESGYDRREFAAAIESGPMREATRDDFARSQTMGVDGFPTVALVRDAQLYLVTSGYATDDVLEYRIAEIGLRLAPNGRQRVIARLAIAFVALAAAAALAAEPGLTARQRGEDFDTAWRAVEQRYAYLDGRQAAWRRVREAWRPRALRAASREQFVGALEGALGELHDDHVTISERTPASPRRVPAESDVWARWSDGVAVVEAIRVYGDADAAGLKPGSRVTHVAGIPIERAVRDRLGRSAARGPADQDWAVRQLLAGERNAPLRIDVEGGRGRTLEIERATPSANNGPLLARRVGESRDLGYIRIKNGPDEARIAAEFDAALETLKDTRALILDLREASAPGSRELTLAILGRFVATPTAWQQRQPRKGATATDSVVPRGPFAYRAPVVVLVDRWTAGEGEALAAGLAAAANARLAGTAMAGLRGELGEVRLPHSGIVVRLPVERAFFIDGTPRERMRPAVEVDLAAPSGGPGDPILYQALKLLEPSSAPARRTAPR